MGFGFIEDIAVAEAFRAWGKTAEELFVAAADAVINVMVADLASIAPRQERAITVTAKDYEMLLLRVPEVTTDREEDHLTLTTVARGGGDRYPPARDGSGCQGGDPAPLSSGTQQGRLAGHGHS